MVHPSPVFLHILVTVFYIYLQDMKACLWIFLVWDSQNRHAQPSASTVSTSKRREGPFKTTGHFNLSSFYTWYVHVSSWVCVWSISSHFPISDTIYAADELYALLFIYQTICPNTQQLSFLMFEYTFWDCSHCLKSTLTSVVLTADVKLGNRFWT